MTILFIGSTTAELQGNRATSGTDTAYTTESSSQQNNFAYTWPLNGPVTTTILWTHFDFFSAAGSNNGTADGFYMDWRDSTNAILARLDVDNGRLFLRMYGASQTTTTSFLVAVNTRYTLDVKIERDAGGVGLAGSFYVNGTLLGSTTPTAVGTAQMPDRIVVQNNDLSSSSLHVTRYSQAIVRDGFSTLNLRLARLEPDADGFYTAWSNTFAELQNMDDTLSTAITGDKESFTVGNYLGAAPTSVVGVFMSVYCLPPETGPNTISAFVRIAGVDYAAPDVAVPEVQNTIHEFAVNPATLAEWSIAEIDALEAGIEAKTI